MGGELRWLCLVAARAAGAGSRNCEISVAVGKTRRRLPDHRRAPKCHELIASDTEPLDVAKMGIHADRGENLANGGVIGLGRVLFYYAPPEKPRATSDIIDLRLIKRSGRRAAVLRADRGGGASQPTARDRRQTAALSG